jgi:hypothetical protein
MSAEYIPVLEFIPGNVHVQSRIQGVKESISITYGPLQRGVFFVTPPAPTHYPRTTGSGNFQPDNPYSPTTEDKAQFTIDLNSESVDNELPNNDFATFINVVEDIDKALLEYVFVNQLKVLGRKNLKKDEVRMLQIPSVRRTVDRDSGMERPARIEPKLRKYYFDAVKNKCVNEVLVCDHAGQVVESGEVRPGDIVCVTLHLGGVYTGVGGDKFGINWTFKEVQVVCQAAHKRRKTSIAAFESVTHEFAHEYNRGDFQQFETI